MDEYKHSSDDAPNYMNIKDERILSVEKRLEDLSPEDCGDSVYAAYDALDEQISDCARRVAQLYDWPEQSIAAMEKTADRLVSMIRAGAKRIGVVARTVVRPRQIRVRRRIPRSCRLYKVMGRRWEQTPLKKANRGPQRPGHSGSLCTSHASDIRFAKGPNADTGEPQRREAHCCDDFQAAPRRASGFSETFGHLGPATMPIGLQFSGYECEATCGPRLELPV